MTSPTPRQNPPAQPGARADLHTVRAALRAGQTDSVREMQASLHAALAPRNRFTFLQLAESQAMQAAKSKKIPVIALYSTDPIGGADNGIYANIGSAAANVRAATRPMWCKRFSIRHLYYNGYECQWLYQYGFGSSNSECFTNCNGK